MTYFVQAEKGGPIKIGFTLGCPYKRLSCLQTGSPVSLRLVGLLDGDKEKELHQQFDAERIRGEWFEPSDRLLSFIADHCSAKLSEAASEKAQVELEGKAAKVRDLLEPRLTESFFTHVFEKDDDFFIINWDDCSDDEECDCDGECVRPHTVESCLQYISCIIYEEKFFERLCVNTDCRIVALQCGPCNSARRFELLTEVADYVVTADDLSSDWWFCALVIDRGKRIGIDLLRLGAFGTKDNAHIFDPELLLRVREGD